MIRFVITAALLAAALGMVLVGVVGVFRFRFVLNRMHAASILDTFGIVLVTAALLVEQGLRAADWKLLLLVVMLGVVAMAVHEVRSLMKIGREMREESEAEMHERLMREAIDKEKARLAAAHYQPEETASEKEEQP